MGDQIQIEHGLLPWEPTEDSELAEVFNYYDMPLAGIIHQRGARYYFTCVEGETEEWTLWAYVHVSSQEQRALGDAPREISRLLDPPRPAVLAVSREGHGIVAALLLEHPEEFESITQAARTELETLPGRFHFFGAAQP